VVLFPYPEYAANQTKRSERTLGIALLPLAPGLSPYSQTIIDGLAQVRLGKHERRVLLRAASPQAQEGAVIAPPGPGRSADEAQRRALRRLQRLGLAKLVLASAR
jgi:hypothetical protein